jgi:MFS transporter, Spinster family, sphingosine-1-phosphate transporter
LLRQDRLKRKIEVNKISYGEGNLAMAPIDSGGETTGSPRYWILVVALLMINTYAFIDRVVLALLVEPIKQDLGASDLQMGILLGLGFALFYAISAIPAGHFVDRHNRRMIIGCASVLWATMTIVCGTATSIEQLFVGRAGVGIAESVIAPAAFSLIRDGVPMRTRGLAFSLYAMAPVIGGATSLLIGSYVLGLANGGAFSGLPLLGSLRPWQCTLVVTGLFGLPVSALLLLAPEPKRRPGQSGGRMDGDGILRGLIAALRHMREHLAIYLPLILFVTFGAMSNFANSSWVPALLGRTWGLTPHEAGQMMGRTVLICGVSGLLLSGLVLNWLTIRGRDIRSYGIIAAIGAASGMVGVGLAQSLTMALAMVGLASFFLGTSHSVGATTLSQVTPVHLMGRVTAIYFLFVSFLGQALGPFLVGYGSQYLFIGRTALASSFALFTGLFGIAMLISVEVLRRHIRRNATASSDKANASHASA